MESNNEQTASQTDQELGVPRRTENGHVRVGRGFEEQRMTVLCGLKPCRNIWLFTACLSMVFVLDGALTRYTADITTYLGRRYLIPEYELDFIIGVQKIGFVITLMFAAYYGNRMQKPVSLAAGCILTAIGSILFATPYFINGSRTRNGAVSDFARAGLCLTGANLTRYSEGQCVELVEVEGERDIAFSLVCVAQFVIGVGGALYATLGIVYIHDNGPPKDAPLFIGQSKSVSCIVSGTHYSLGTKFNMNQFIM